MNIAIDPIGTVSIPVDRAALDAALLQTGEYHIDNPALVSLLEDKIHKLHVSSIDLVLSADALSVDPDSTMIHVSLDVDPDNPLSDSITFDPYFLMPVESFS